MNTRETVKKAAYFGAILVLMIVVIYSGLQILEATVFSKEQVEETLPVSKTIVRDGVEYFPKQDMMVLMVLGIDQTGPVQASDSYNNHGASDMVALLIFDEASQTCRVLTLNRDTMLEMPVLGIGGKQAGTYYGQLALSHTYGSGLEDSCENTRQAVSDLLYGLYIDYYVAMNMDAIAIANDAVGGVTVQVDEDFSAVDPTIPMGTVTLQGEQALRYVRTRKDLGDQLNLSRMDRHEKYMKSFLKSLGRRLEESDTFALELYDAVDEYMVTDCSANTLSSIMSRYAEYEIVEIVSPAGDNVLGKQYYEFYVDEEALDQLILRLLYAPKR
ncbi:MAG: LCP family protein [Lachnospiraceae bacterium]|nr:LCP family protein [Lachnospiraceae bacterium]